MRVRALKGFRHRVTGAVAEGAVLDIESRELADGLIADGWVTASKLPAEVVVADPPAETVVETTAAKPTRSRRSKA
jgi:hypothetical protein